MTKQKLDYKLDPEEKELLRSVEAGEWESVPNAKQEMKKMREAAINTMKLRKSANLNIRLRPDTLAGLKAKAKKADMPYQTLVGILLHQFATGRITLTL
jgi:predicted DNA binding CopG/RHH family protein